MPVARGSLDQVEGVVNVKDLFFLLANDQLRSIGQVQRPVLFVPENVTLEQLLIEFRKRRRQIAVVVDEHGGTSGVFAEHGRQGSRLGGETYGLALAQRQHPVVRAFAIDRVEDRMRGDLALDLHRLRDVARPAPITLEDLPAPLRERYVGKSGKWLLQVFGKESLWEF